MELLLILLSLWHPRSTWAAGRSNIADIKVYVDHMPVKDNSILSSCTDNCKNGICRNIVMPRECVFYKLKSEYVGMYQNFSEVDYPESKSEYHVKALLLDTPDCQSDRDCHQNYALDLKSTKIERIDTSVAANKIWEWLNQNKMIVGIVAGVIAVVVALVKKRT